MLLPLKIINFAKFISLLRINIRYFTWSFRFLFMVFNATFNNISVISWHSVLSHLLTRRVPLVEQKLITFLQVLCVCFIDRCLSCILLASVLSVLLWFTDSDYFWYLQTLLMMNLDYKMKYITHLGYLYVKKIIRIKFVPCLF